MISIHAPREGCDPSMRRLDFLISQFQSTHPARGATEPHQRGRGGAGGFQSTHPARGATSDVQYWHACFGYFNPRTPRGVRRVSPSISLVDDIISIHAPREGCDHSIYCDRAIYKYFNPRTPRGVRQQTLLKSREFAWLNLLICTRGRRLSIQKQTRLCSIKLSFMLFGCEPAGEGVSSWTSHATKSKVRLEGRSAYSQSVRSSAHSDFPGNKSGGCPVRDP